MRTLYDHFLSAASQYPSRTAVVYDDGSTRYSETYLELSRRSEELAQFIAAHGVCRATIACLCESSASVVCVILGVLKSSCAFVFLRPECRENCLQSLVDESGPVYLLGELFLYNKCFRSGSDQWRVLGALWDDAFVLASHCNNTSERLEKPLTLLEPLMAYVMFTSGTTGEPKVVRVPHQCALQNVLHLRSIFNICEDDVIFQAAPLTFDPSVVEIFLALTTGAQLVLTSGTVKQIPRAATQLLIDNRVTVIQATPSFIRSLGIDRIKNSLLAKDSCLRILAFGGEECPSVDCINSWKHPENSTEIYNLYGITEVSCWATCHKIGPAGDGGAVPLGAPLDGTVLEVRDDSGEVVEKGDGTLFVGGSLRRCLIGSEKWESLDACQMRDTGDIVRKTSAGLMFLGRRDSIFKYHGKKIDPTRLAKRLAGNRLVESCHSHFARREQLLYFFVVLCTGCEAETAVPQLRQEMAGECLCPFRIEAVHGWPLTSHGKVDIRALLKYHRKRRKPQHGSDPVKLLARLWNASLAQNEDAFVPGDSSFVAAGGNSLCAVSISQELEFALGRPLPLLVDKILNDNFGEVEAYLGAVFQEHGPPVHSAPKHQKVGPGAVRTVVHHLVPAQTTSCFTCISRFETWQHCSCAQRCFKPERKQHRALGSLKVSEKWKFDLGKCIDASPLVVNYERGATLVFIGSHAGRFCALSLDSGKCFWEIHVPDRIESSAGLSSCGRYVAFGCYDHRIYCADVVDGTVRWTVNTGAEVKSSPAANRVNTSFVCGSHDQCVYCVKQDTGDLLWKQSLAEGSVFSSPAISYQPYQIYAATLGGLVAALSPETGAIVWTCKLDKPIFSSPIICDSAVGICCVGGRICLLDQSSGSKLWITEAGGPIFSTLSPTVSAEGPAVVVGCHDRHVYKISTKDGQVLWRTCLGAPIYSTLFCPNDRDVCVGAVTQGVLFIVHSQSGEVLSLYHFDNEVFSSPVMFEDYIFVGCRDNYAYCLLLTSECSC